LSGDDTITLGVAGTFALGLHGSGDDAPLSGDLDITDDLTITGSARSETVVDGDGADPGSTRIRWGAVGRFE
jgi:hypothetical protein